MTKLIKDILFHCPKPSDLDRLRLSPGTESVSNLSDAIQKEYKDNAFIPINDWSELTVAQKEIVSSKTIDSELPYNYVLAGTIPNTLFTPLQKEIHLSDDLTDKELDRIKESDAFDYHIKKILEYFSTFVDSEKYKQYEYFEVGTLINKVPSTIITSTRDRQEHNKLVGLHVDNHDKQPLKSRHESTSRICLNLGTKPRYLYYQNVSTKHVQTLLLNKIDSLDFSTFSFRKFYLLFLSHFPNYPVLRVQLNPGDYYHAPTEMIIHDGYFESKTDLSLMVRSHFSF